MILAAPQDQSEYDNLKHLVKDLNHREISATIAGYRSEENKNLWIIGGKKLNFDVTWGHGEPNNANDRENCYSKSLRSFIKKIKVLSRSFQIEGFNCLYERLYLLGFQ